MDRHAAARGGAAVHGGREDLRHSVRRGHGRVLVQQGPVRQGGHHRAAGHLGRAADHGQQDQGCGHRPDRAGRQGEVAGAFLLGLPRYAHRRPGSAPEGGRGRQLRHPGLHRGRSAPQGAGRPAAVPEGFPGRGVRLAGRAGRDHGQRRGGDGADGPVGPVGPGVLVHQQEGAGRQARLLRVPGRGRRQGHGGGGVRRRQRVRGRQERARVDDGLPEDAAGRGQPAQDCGDGCGAADGEGRRGRDQGPEQQDGGVEPGVGDRVPAVPGPGVPAGGGSAGQRQRGRADRGIEEGRGPRQGHHHGGQEPVRYPAGDRTGGRTTAGPGGTGAGR